LNVYLPWEAAAAAIATTQLQGATSNMYANCDANQLYNQFATLVDFSQTKAELIDTYGRLGSRTLGLLVYPLWGEIDCMKAGFSNDDFFKSGECLGEILSSVFDSIL